MLPEYTHCDYCGKVMTGAQYRFKLQGRWHWVGTCCWKKLVEKETTVK